MAIIHNLKGATVRSTRRRLPGLFSEDRNLNIRRYRLIGDKHHEPEYIPPCPSFLISISDISETLCAASTPSQHQVAITLIDKAPDYIKRTLNYIVSSNVAWVTPSPSFGSLMRNETDTVDLNFTQIDTSSNGTILISGFTDNCILESYINIAISAVDVSRLTITPLSYTISAMIGNTISPSSLFVSNISANTMNYAVSDNVGWLVVSPSVSSANPNITNEHTIAYDVSALGVGVYTGIVNVSANRCTINPYQTAMVTLSVLQEPEQAALLYVVYRPTQTGSTDQNWINIYDSNFNLQVSSIRLSSFVDVESLTWVSGSRFAIQEERLQTGGSGSTVISAFRYTLIDLPSAGPNGITIDKSTGATYTVGISSYNNQGIEGITYVSANNTFYVCREGLQDNVYEDTTGPFINRGEPGTLGVWIVSAGTTNFVSAFNAEAMWYSGGYIGDTSDIHYEHNSNNLIISRS